VKVAARHHAPIVPFGIGSSLEGHVNAIHGGVSIDFSKMNRVLAINAEDLDATVEAGITHGQLNKALHNTGLAFWVDPGADATIGGMAATRASGTTAVRYGTMREAVLGLTVVLADGRVIRTGSRARKSSAGYDLTRLFVGSEGTLGVITEITVRLFGLPEAVSAAVCPFDSMDGAVRTVITTIQLGIPVARIELLDEDQLDAVNRYSKLNCELKPTLFFEFHGTSNQAVSESATLVREIASEHGGHDFRVLRGDRASARLSGVDDRCVRADFPPRGVCAGDAGRRARSRCPCPAGWSRGRRQFSSYLSNEPGRPDTAGKGQGHQRSSRETGPGNGRHLQR
jgi:D-lactate dehydrogenase (cytochrome)